jgi:inositol-phosphate transport system ATP-binding protein
MNSGRVEQEGTSEDLYERPATLFVASFVGSPPINTFDGQAAGSSLSVDRARLTLSEPVQGPVVLGLRPEIVRVGGAGDSGRTDSRITAVEPMGREVLYTADSAFGTMRFLEAGAEPRHREGATVALGFPASSALLFDKASGRRLEARVAV